MSNIEVRPYKVVEHRDGGVEALCLTEGPHSGIVFSYGKVNFVEEEETDTLITQFEYEVHDDKANPDYDLQELEQELGEFLLELIAEGLQNNSNVYSGGAD